MAARTASKTMRLPGLVATHPHGLVAARLGAVRAAVLPAKEASMGLRNFTSIPKNIAGLHKKSVIGFVNQCSRRRFISERPDGRGRIYEFEDVLSAIEDPSDARLLIDVREPHEFGTDSIPTAINLPITSRPDALLLPPAEFQDQFGFAKPPIGKELVFFCKAGVRSKAAAGIARQAGYTNVGEYPGSWNDWQKKGGPRTHSPSAAGGLDER
ncbi:Rhodanese-like protein [Didymella exigua CBS 183.55]|uniref:Rhodanese-like protein n=1 Tax=Didymella exigua CBS 183.55 TaxID=1150837 RepID=A0A6A5RI91_9PLEO|nr:Rhodanese-like protein [Didymella exigua CBS 183.55]KAF1926960.1 Rhodanese-like protein [Didymella exigua CBS 183.55]